MHEDNYRLIRQKLEGLFQQEIDDQEASPPESGVGFSGIWQRLRYVWNRAIVSLTPSSRLLNYAKQANVESGDFGYWYSFGWQAWAYSRLEHNPEDRRGWLEQVYRHSKSDG